MKLLKNKDFIVSVLFVAVIIIGFFGTVVTSAKQIAWNVVRNHDEYNTDNTINSQVRSYITAYESSFDDNIFLKEKYVDVFGFLQNVMGKRVIPTNGFTGTIVKGSDNKLYTASSVTINSSGKKAKNDDIKDYADSLINLKNQLSAMNAQLLYVQAPQKYYADVKVPISIDAKYLDTRSKKLLKLINGKVDYIDFNEIIYNNNINRDTVFFKTDHHWTAESAFICYQNICPYLIEKFSFPIDDYLFDSSSWEFNVIKNSYLGSTGVRVGKYYVGADDFTFITPRFETDFIREYASTETVTYKGDFSHSVIDNYDKAVSGNTNYILWGDYCGADTSFVSIKNNTSENNKKILVVKDSFALPVCAFMSTTCKQLDIYDLRSEHNDSLIELIKENKYDLVMILYNPESLTKSFFEFGN